MALTEERRLLGQLYRLLKDVERCKSCGGSIAESEDHHENQYKRLMEKVGDVLAGEPS